MPHAIKVLLCTGFLACLATVAAANPVEQIFTQANVVGQRTAHDVQYLLPLGRVKDDRKAGRAQPAKFERLQGNLAAVTWKLEGALSLQESVVPASGPYRVKRGKWPLGEPLLLHRPSGSRMCGSRPAALLWHRQA